MNDFILYTITFITAIIIIGGYNLTKVILKSYNKNSEKFTKWFSIALAGLTGIVIFMAMFFVPGVMSTKTGSFGHFDTTIGCVNLVGIPYGDNKFLNFLAWFGNAVFLPSAIKKQ